MKCGDFKKSMTDYLAGEMTPEQIAEFEEHLNECQKCQAEFEKAQEFWLKLADAMATEEIPELKLEYERRSAILDAPESKQKPILFRHYPLTLKFAAAIILGAFIGMIALPVFRKQLSKEPEGKRYIRFKGTESSAKAVQDTAMKSAETHSFTKKTKPLLRAAIAEDKFKEQRTPEAYTSKAQTSIAATDNIKMETLKLAKEPATAPRLVAKSYKRKAAEVQDVKKVMVKAEVQDVKKVYSLNFAKYKIATEIDFEKFLKKHQIPMPYRVNLDLKENKVTMHACPEMIKNFDEFFDKINAPIQKRQTSKPEQK
ncbi:MAG: hypothetical protein GY750_07800 [Lentisphaerae bacterium]|nr:hypothetical protein [Lentisphaerota bacterium]MCP4101310.1 hypothetical protein [Lentisphaerota bacterium]